MSSLSEVSLTVADVEAVRPAVQAIARQTPLLSSRTFSQRVAGKIALKAENLQRTGSFKVRGAAAKLATLSKEERDRGVVAASAGNHAQGIAAAAHAAGVRCEVFVPQHASLSKVDAARGQGAVVRIGGLSVDHCIEAARERATVEGPVFVHPFDDIDVIRGQGTIGLELIEAVDDLAKVVVPIGGGGLASGIAAVLKQKNPAIEVVGVQAAACAAYPESLKQGTPLRLDPAATIADGIAVKKPGGLTLPLVDRWVDDVVTVEEDEIAEAMVLLLERCKLVVEGAGAVSVAALLSDRTKAARSGQTVALLSGGNVDISSLAAIGRLHETQAGRRVVLVTRLADNPGALAGLLEVVATTHANIIEIHHVREGLKLSVRQTAVELVLETRGNEHAIEVMRTLAHAGYPTTIVH